MGLMRWLSRECLTGVLDDDEWNQRHDEYGRQREALLSTLRAGSPEQELADLNLHDGQPTSWSFRDAEFEMPVLVGDLQRGYEWVVLRYLGAELIPVTAVDDLSELPFDESEIGADELEELPDGRFEHRFLLWPTGEFALRFRACAIASTTARPSDRRTG